MEIVGAHVIVNSIDPDQTALGAEQSNLGLALLLRHFNPMYFGGLVHCYTLDESICHFGVPGLSCCFCSIFDRTSC